MYLYLKALHIVAVVSWFAGLFYIVRLFVYLTETAQRPEAERAVLLPQLELMATRLWLGITWPAGIATLILGFSMLPTWWPTLGSHTWLQVKLVAVAGLCGYHAVCHWLFRRLLARAPPWSSRSLRIWNEVATLFLVGIVFLVVVKDGLSLIYGVVGLTVFAGALMAGITLYRRLRTA